MQACSLADDLIERRVDEPVELDLAHWAVAAQRHAHGSADDAGFGKRRIDHPMFAEVLLQAFGNSEDPTELADVLASDHDFRIGFQRSAQARIERLRHGHHGHQTPPESAGSTCSSPSPGSEPSKVARYSA